MPQCCLVHKLPVLFYYKFFQFLLQSIHCSCILCFPADVFYSSPTKLTEYAVWNYIWHIISGSVIFLRQPFRVLGSSPHYTWNDWFWDNGNESNMMLLEHTLVVNLPVLVITTKLQNVTTCLPSVNDGWRWRGGWVCWWKGWIVRWQTCEIHADVSVVLLHIILFVHLQFRD